MRHRNINPRHVIERRALQGAVLIAGLVPVSTGLAGMIVGGGMAGGAGTTDLDSHVRYLSGLLLGIGLLFWGMVPSIERHGPIVRALTFLVVIGGLARLAGWLFVGTPSTPMIAAVGMELVVTPLLCLWQIRLASPPTT